MGSVVVAITRKENSRGVRWEASYRGPDSKERTKTFDRKVDAERWLRAQETARDTGEWLDPQSGRAIFGEYGTSWLSVKRSAIALRTYVNIEGRWRNHIEPVFAKREIASIRPADVRQWVADLLNGGMAPDTARKVLQVLAQIFRQAEIDRLISRSPIIGIELPRAVAHQEMRFLTADEVALIAESIEPRYRTLIFTAAYCGLRAGELGFLRADSLDLLRGQLEVRGSLAEVGGRILEGPTKTRKVRTVAVPRFLSTMLADHLPKYAAGGYVFSAPDGGPLRHRNFVRRQFHPAVERAGLAEGLRFHDLRHTCAALLIASGTHLQEVKEHLGHASIRTTSDRYGHLYDAARERLRDRLDATFAQSPADFPRTSDGETGSETSQAAPKSRLTRTSVERTTGFEPATLTLAR
jgi:integrase